MIHDSQETENELPAVRAVAMSEPHSPHIIRVDGFLFQNNRQEGVSRTFIKMQLCNGTLAEYLSEKLKRGQPMEPIEIVEVMLQLLAGLNYCHERGLCHRDLKLTNSIFP